MQFGAIIKTLRLEVGMTQIELSNVSGVALGTLRDYEQGKRAPSLSNAQKLGRALGHTLGVFDDATPDIRGKGKK